MITNKTLPPWMLLIVEVFPALSSPRMAKVTFLEVEKITSYSAIYELQLMWWGTQQSFFHRNISRLILVVSLAKFNMLSLFIMYWFLHQGQCTACTITIIINHSYRSIHLVTQLATTLVDMLTILFWSLLLGQ